jgi:hypothetical protein
MEWMILQSLVLQVTAESSIITKKTSASILLEIKNITAILNITTPFFYSKYAQKNDKREKERLECSL